MKIKREPGCGLLESLELIGIGGNIGTIPAKMALRIFWHLMAGIKPGMTRQMATSILSANGNQPHHDSRKMDEAISFSSQFANEGEKA